MKEKVYSPTALNVLTITYDNHTTNLRNDLLPNTNLLPIWRLAKLVTTEQAPLLTWEKSENEQV